MKTTRKLQNTIHSFRIFFSGMMLMMISFSVLAQAQDSTQTLFRSTIRVSEQWTPLVKVNTIQGDIGSLVGFYGGVLLNRSVLLGITGGVNLSHPRVNYGYFGGFGQVILQPAKLVHLSGQLELAYGTTKDYEQPKSGLLDNFWNISGASFFLCEPGLNIELNLSRRLTLVAGASYRWVSGLDEDNENIQITHVTNQDMSGLNFTLGLKMNKVKKIKD